MNVLFVCTENAGRSQLAEHLFNTAAPEGHEARSSGTKPREAIYPTVVEALAKRGIEAGKARTKVLDQDLIDWADRVVTMGCADECPATGKPTEDWDLQDVKDLPPEEVELVAADIEVRIRGLLEDAPASG